jgi:hypothetical protein
MTDFTVIVAKPWHCGQMIRLLRRGHKDVIAKIGVDSHRELRSRFDHSSFRRAWMIDGKLAGLGGVTGSTISSQGYVWLALSNHALKFPLEIIREARRQLAIIMTTKRDLVTTILDGDDVSKRFAIFLGFVPVGDEWVNRAASRFGRREVARQCETLTEARFAIGNGFGIAMTYQPEQVA